jgi:hypothetical protein
MSIVVYGSVDVLEMHLLCELYLDSFKLRKEQVKALFG